MSFDNREFRNTMGLFATGVIVVSSVAANGSLSGSTVNSFSSVSLSPPLVLFSLMASSPSVAHYAPNRNFGCSILAKDQATISNHFAKSGDGKWSAVEYETWQTGVPLLSGALANFEGTVIAHYEGGDHTIILGRVENLRTNPMREMCPLVFHRGKYALIDEIA
jgi:flavin reductase (DIM6/NTAB) family NADH-FMN oxidoreductase RutF